MTPAAILSDALADGLTLVAEPGGTILVRGPAEARAHWLPVIRASKEMLLLALVHTENSETSYPNDHHNRHNVTPPPPLTTEDLEEAVAERAAIMEYDGGVPRATAEAQARRAMRVYRCLVAMPEGHPGEPKWVTMLLPGVETLDGAREAAQWRFGTDRVLEVRP